MEEVRRFIAGADDADTRLDIVLSNKYEDLTRSYIQKLIKSGNVKINNEYCIKAKSYISPGDTCELLIPAPKSCDIVPKNIDLDILYEDDDILIVNKPKGMVVHPSEGHYDDTLVNAIMYHCGHNLSGINGILRPGIVHRIDKDTTGSLIVCKNDKAHLSIAQQLKEHSIKRSYRLIVYNNFSEDEGTIDAPLGRHPIDRKKRAVVHNGKPAITHYKVISHLNKKYNYLECRLETGRTHQIRVHMSYISHPLLGDELYGKNRSEFKALNGQVLHAAVIGFIHPSTGKYMEFEAPLPDYFVDLLRKLDYGFM